MHGSVHWFITRPWWILKNLWARVPWATLLSPAWALYRLRLVDVNYGLWYQRWESRFKSFHSLHALSTFLRSSNCRASHSVSGLRSHKPILLSRICLLYEGASLPLTTDRSSGASASWPCCASFANTSVSSLDVVLQSKVQCSVLSSLNPSFRLHFTLPRCLRSYNYYHRLDNLIHYSRHPYLRLPA